MSAETFLPLEVRSGLPCSSRATLDSHFLLRLTCIMVSLTVPYKGLILAPLRPENLFFHHRDIDHMKVVVIHILPQSFRHGSVALIGVHDGREDILLTAHDLYGSFVCVGVELLGIFISAVIVKVSGVHIKNQFPRISPHRLSDHEWR